MADWGSLVSGTISGLGYKDAYDKVGQQQDKSNAYIDNLMQNTQSALGFKPWTVTSSLGNVTNNQGNMSFNLSPEQKAIQDQMFAQGRGLLTRASQDPTQRQNQLFGAMQASFAPEALRQKKAMNEALQQGGRGAMTSASYGGSPEQLAYQKALQEQQLSNWLGAQGAATSELDSQYQRGAGMMGMGYQPSQQLLGYGQIGQQGYEQELKRLMNQVGQRNQLGLGRLTSDNNFENIKGGMFGNMVQGASTLAGGATNALSNTNWGNLGNAAGSVWDTVKGWF